MGCVKSLEELSAVHLTWAYIGQQYVYAGLSFGVILHLGSNDQVQIQTPSALAGSSAFLAVARNDTGNVKQSKSHWRNNMRYSNTGTKICKKKNKNKIICIMQNEGGQC